MNFTNLIKENEETLFSLLKEDIKQDPLISAKIDEDKLNEILELQEELLKNYIQDFNNDKLYDEDIVKFYKDFDIPFEVIYRSLNVLKDKLLVLLKKEHTSLVEVYNFSNYFQHLIDLIAKVYIKRSTSSLKGITDTIFKDKILISVHIDWLERIILAIEKDELQYYPLVTLKECKFTKYLYYPESLMVCLDKKLCTYLEDMHKVIHRLADTLYLHLKNEEYSEGYFVFKDFINQTKKFIDTISDMYYMTYSNPERSLLKFLELIGFDKEVFVSMISFTNYQELIDKFGEKLVIEAVNEVSEKISRVIDKTNTIAIKGFNFNIFLANLDISVKKYKEFIASLKDYFTLEIDGKKIELKSIIVGFEIDMYKNIKSYEIIEILDKLKAKAINENKDELLILDENKDFVNRIISDKYDGKFILSAFDKGDIEVVAQPIFDSKHGIHALEILGRIKDYKKLVPMKELIRKIEDMGLLKTLDLLVSIKLQNYEKYLPKVTNAIFLNVNTDTIINKSYLKNLEAFQKKTGVQVILEISEVDFIAQYRVLENIYKEHGLSFAIDNFESQCISVEKFIYLIDKGIVKYLKISKLALIENKEKILQILKYLKESFGVRIVIKHIEDEDMLRMVEKYGFTYLQGFYLEKPKPIDELLLESS